MYVHTTLRWRIGKVLVPGHLDVKLPATPAPAALDDCWSSRAPKNQRRELRKIRDFKKNTLKTEAFPRVFSPRMRSKTLHCTLASQISKQSKPLYELNDSPLYRGTHSTNSLETCVHGRKLLARVIGDMEDEFSKPHRLLVDIGVQFPSLIW